MNRRGIKVAAAQMDVTGDVDANVGVISRAIEFAIQEGADILLTPEGSVSGYTTDFDAKHVSDAVKALAARAAAGNLALALGTCFVEADDNLCYNQLRFYDRTGTLLGFHAKILRCGSLEDPSEGEIHEYAVRPLWTFEMCGVTVGGLICNDLWANPGCTPMDDPHLARQLSRKGARIVFHAVNGGRSGTDFDREVVRHYHESNLRLRAQAGRVWVVTTDNSFPSRWPTSSPSGVLSPDGNWMTRAPEAGEHFFTCDLTVE